MKRLFYIFILLMLAGGIQAADIVKVFQHGAKYGNCKDATLRESDPYDCYSDGTDLIIKDTTAGNDITRRFIIRWDSLARYKADSCPTYLVSSAVCSLKLAYAENGIPTVTPHKILEQWTDDYTCVVGVPTWNYRKTSSTAWTNSGAGPTTSSASAGCATGQVIGATIDVWYTWTIDTSLINAWIADSTTNYGLVFRGAEGSAINPCAYRTFYSSQHTTAANRPILRVTFTPSGGGSGTKPKVKDIKGTGLKL